MFVRSLLSVALVEFTSKFSVKLSLSGYIAHQKAFIFGPWVCFHAMSIGLRVHRVKVSVTYNSRFSDFALHLEDYFMYEYDSLG